MTKHALANSVKEAFGVKGQGKKNGKVAKLPKVGDKLTPKEWAALINAAWNKTSAALLETARLTLTAHDTLTQSGWKELRYECSLKIDNGKISRLIKVAKVKAFYKRDNLKLIPPCLTTLWTLAELNEEQLTKAFDKEDIHAAMTIEDAEQLVAKFTGKPKKEKQAKVIEVENEPVNEAEEEADDSEADVDDETEDEVASASVSPRRNSEPETDDFQRALENFEGGMDSLAMFCEFLEDAMERTGKTRLPKDVLKSAGKLARVLDRFVSQYG